MNSYFSEIDFKKKSFIGFLGKFDPTSAEKKQMKVISGIETSDRGEKIALHFLIDLEDGVIADAKFQVFGPIELYQALGAVCELALLKSYVKVSKITSSMIEQKLESTLKNKLKSSFSKAINLCLFALDDLISQCQDIPVEEKELVTPLEENQDTFEVPNWLKLDVKTQLQILEDVIQKDIRPYIEMDEGGIDIVSLKDGIFLTIGYKGACTTCHASTGSTLNAIQQILRSKVFPAIVVIPDASWISRDEN
jgi:NifU-like protein